MQLLLIYIYYTIEKITKRRNYKKMLLGLLESKGIYTYPHPKSKIISSQPSSLKKVNHSKDPIARPGNISFEGKFTRSFNKFLVGILLATANIADYSCSLTKPIQKACNCKKPVYANFINPKDTLLNFLKNIPEKTYMIKPSKVNLHIHSTFSDGKLTVKQIIDQAIEKGKTVIAIPDHNTTKHLKEIEKYRDYASKKGLTIINDLELTAYKQNTKLHFLILGADLKDSCLNEMCKIAKTDSEKLNADFVLEKLSPNNVVVLAHPMVYERLGIKSLIKGLKNKGLDGLEVFYPYENLGKIIDNFEKSPVNPFCSHIAVFREKIVNPNKIADEFKLLKTGGSDSHSLDIDRN